MKMRNGEIRAEAQSTSTETPYKGKEKRVCLHSFLPNPSQGFGKTRYLCQGPSTPSAKNCGWYLTGPQKTFFYHFFKKVIILTADVYNKLLSA